MQIVHLTDKISTRSMTRVFCFIVQISFYLIDVGIYRVQQYHPTGTIIDIKITVTAPVITQDWALPVVGQRHNF